jgi:hypothetical protein
MLINNKEQHETQRKILRRQLMVTILFDFGVVKTSQKRGVEGVQKSWARIKRIGGIEGGINYGHHSLLYEFVCLASITEGFAFLIHQTPFKSQ